MIRTRVGYAGGTTGNPTYASLGDHAETVEIDFDPARISYERLLDLFWESHSPGSLPWRRQYMSAVFYHTDAQRRQAERTGEREARRIGRPVHTEILPAAGFTRAEDYHQKFYLRRHPELLKELAAAYPSPRGLVDSTAAARINGFLGSHGTYEELLAEIDGYGLSAGGRDALLGIVRRHGSGRGASAGCPVDGPKRADGAGPGG